MKAALYIHDDTSHGSFVNHFANCVPTKLLDTFSATLARKAKRETLVVRHLQQLSKLCQARPLACREIQVYESAQPPTQRKHQHDERAQQETAGLHSHFITERCPISERNSRGTLRDRTLGACKEVSSCCEFLLKNAAPFDSVP